MRAPPASWQRKVRVGWRRAPWSSRVILVATSLACLLCFAAGMARRDGAYFVIGLSGLFQAANEVHTMIAALASLRGERTWERTKRRWAKAAREWRAS